MINRVMTVSERRYLKKNYTVACNFQLCGVYSTKSLEIFTWSYKAHIVDHAYLSLIDIALKKLSLP